MTEGPFIVFFKNKLQRYKGKIVSTVSGELEIDYAVFKDLPLVDIETFGENLIFLFKDFFVLIKMDSVAGLLVNKRKKIDPFFSFQFKEGEINFYNSEVKIFKGKPTDHFNFKTDILKKEFEVESILFELQTHYSQEKIGGALLNQNIFAGIGPIIRTETLYHAKIHPESLIKGIPEKKLIFLINVLVDYAEEFLTLVKTDQVKESALIFEKKICPKDKTPILIEEVGNIKTYVCPKCQKLFK